MLPHDDVRNRADINSQLATLFAEIGDVDRSLIHRREAIKEYDAARRPFAGAKMRLSMADILLKMGRFMDAYEYAQAALEMLKPFGDQADELGPRSSCVFRRRRQKNEQRGQCQGDG